MFARPHPAPRSLRDLPVIDSRWVPLLCWVGLHRWQDAKAGRVVLFRECRRCHARRMPPRRPDA
jgi:hypothetical protein